MSRPAAWAGNRAAVSTNILRNPSRRHRVQGFPLPSVSIDECSSALRPLPTRGSRYGKGRARILRILLVDDDPGLRTPLRTTFEVADVAVVEAENADAARRKIRAGPPDVIVLDVNMPGTTGLELCAELKAAPETKDIPIVLLTGSEGGSSAAAKRAGADAFARDQEARHGSGGRAPALRARSPASARARAWPAAAASERLFGDRLRAREC